MGVKLTEIPHYRFYAFLIAFAAVLAIAWPFQPLAWAILTSFDLAVVLFVLLTVHEFRSDEVPRGIKGDDGGRVLHLILSTIILGVVLYAIGWMISGKDQLDKSDFLMAAASLLTGWIFINLIYAFHYAHLYYGPRKDDATVGLDFPGKAQPVFSDFCYFSFVIGMTCQVSDVVITSRRLRRVAFFHGMLAFVFNLCVLALTVNVISGAL